MMENNMENTVEKSGTKEVVEDTSAVPMVEKGFPMEENPTPVEKAEEEKKTYNPEDAPDYPAYWKKKKLKELVELGYKYYRKPNPQGKIYMIMRKGKHDKGIGLWSETNEQKLVGYYPQLDSLSRGPPQQLDTTHLSETAEKVGDRSYTSMPIRRTAVIPRDFVPSIAVIRYFQILKNNGFLGDFSDFINDVVTTHFANCHGIILPVLVKEQEETTLEWK